MRRLLLFRHAKAERAEAGQSDLDRPLSRQGLEEAELIGAYIARHAFMPDVAVVSPSVRTRETFSRAAAAMMLVGTGDIETRERLREKFPTAALAIIDFPLDSWARLHPSAGRLERCIEPKLIARTTR